MTKRGLEKRVSNLEPPEDLEDFTITIGKKPEKNSGPSLSIAEDLREDLAEKLSKEPEEIEIEDKENPISELVSRISQVMEENQEAQEPEPKGLEEAFEDEFEVKKAGEFVKDLEEKEPESEPEPEEIEEPEEEAEDKESLFVSWGENKIEKYDRDVSDRPRNAKEAAPY